MKTWLVTGGAGFIGSTFVRMCRARADARIVNLDLLTYAGNPANLNELHDDPDHIFVRGDINDRELVRGLFAGHRPDAVVHFAAESHVDRSILGPDTFIRANINGTFALLEEARYYWNSLNGEEKDAFRFHHISTDEVYGSLGPDDHPFTETTAYHPNSPYSASKAASDHLVAAYHATYGLPALITNCSNNYGPYQFPEKLIPLMITNARAGKPLPVYGDGMNIRDWLYVEDHCEAIVRVLTSAVPGEMYNIGGLCEMANIDVVKTICAVMDRLFPDSPHTPHESLITYVADRPGHDRRYAIDASRIGRDLGWKPHETFVTGMEKTIRWYIDHPAWIEGVQSGAYRDWIDRNYGQR